MLIFRRKNKMCSDAMHLRKSRLLTLTKHIALLLMQAERELNIHVSQWIMESSSLMGNIVDVFLSYIGFCFFFGLIIESRVRTCLISMRVCIFVQSRASPLFLFSFFFCFIPSLCNCPLTLAFDGKKMDRELCATHKELEMQIFFFVFRFTDIHASN